MKKTIDILLVLALAFCLGITASACGSACTELARKICDCQPTRSKEVSCDLAIDAAKENFKVSKSEENACQDILDSGSCTCEALAADDLSACGLSNDAQVIYE